MFNGWAPFDVTEEGLDDPTDQREPPPAAMSESGMHALITGYEAAVERTAPLPRLMVTDWRGLGRWTTDDRRRPASIVSCRALAAPPIPGATTLLSTIFGYYMLDEKPAGDPRSFDYRIAKIARENGYDVFPTTLNGQLKPSRMVLWSSSDGRQKTYALNVTQSQVPRMWGRERASKDVWADGYHVDYLTGFGWLLADPGYTAAYGIDGMQDAAQFWDRFDEGMGNALQVLRYTRSKSTILLGQQFHNGKPPNNPQMWWCNGRYCEESPTHFGMTFAKHRMLFEQWRSFCRVDRPLQGHALELRTPWAWSADYVQQTLDLAVEFDSAVSWGRDATGGIGWPA